MPNRAGDSYSSASQLAQNDQDTRTSAIQQSLNRLIQVAQQRKQNEQQDRQFQFMLKQHGEQQAQQQLANDMAKAAVLRQASQDTIRHQEFKDSLALTEKFGTQRTGDQETREKASEFNAAFNQINNGGVLNRDDISLMFPTLSGPHRARLEAVWDAAKARADANHQTGEAAAGHYNTLLQLEKSRTADSKNKADTEKQNARLHWWNSALPNVTTNQPVLDSGALEQWALRTKLPPYVGLDPATQTVTNAVPRIPFTFTPKQLDAGMPDAMAAPVQAVPLVGPAADPTLMVPEPVVAAPTAAVVPVQPVHPEVKRLQDWAKYKIATNPDMAPEGVAAILSALKQKLAAFGVVAPEAVSAPAAPMNFLQGLQDLQQQLQPVAPAY